MNRIRNTAVLQNTKTGPCAIALSCERAHTFGGLSFGGNRRSGDRPRPGGTSGVGPSLEYRKVFMDLTAKADIWNELNTGYATLSGSRHCPARVLGGVHDGDFGRRSVDGAMAGVGVRGHRARSRQARGFGRVIRWRIPWYNEAAEPPSRRAAEPPSRRAAEPPSRRAAEPPSRRAAEPPSRRAAEPPFLRLRGAA